MKAYSLKNIVTLFLAVVILSGIVGMYGIYSSHADAASKKPSFVKKISIGAGEQKAFTIESDGYKIKKTTVKITNNKSAITVKASKTTITVTGIKTGKATFVTTIKATKGRKTKNYKITTIVTVNPEPDPNPIIQGTNMSVKINGPMSLTLSFNIEIDFQSITRLRMFNPTSLVTVGIKYDNYTIGPDKRSVTIELNNPGMSTGSEYKILLEQENYEPAYVVFTFERTTLSIQFKDGDKKKLKKIKYVDGGKIGTFVLRNNYGLTPEYSLSGLDSAQFIIDENGVLSWKSDAMLPKNRKKLSVTINAYIPLSDLFNEAYASLNLTITLK